jgi:plastocyanin
MKKLLTLLIIGLFTLAACQPVNLAAAGNDTGAMVDNTMEIEDSTEEPGDDSDGEDSDSMDDMNETETPEASETMEADSMDQMDDSMSRGNGYIVDVSIESAAFDTDELMLHEDSTIQWTNNDAVSYTITIVKTDDSSDDSMDDSPDDEMDEYTYEITVAPGETVSFTLDDSGTYSFSISDGADTISGTLYVSDDYSDDEYDDDYDDDSYGDDSYDDDSYDDDSYDDDSYDDDSNDDDSYDDDSSDDDYEDDDYEDDEYDDEEDDEEDDSSSYLFQFVI